MSTQPAPDFGTLLRRHRRAANLTQEELAARAGVSVDAISALERGVSRAPHKDTVELLAEALKLAPAERAKLEAAARRSSPPEGETAPESAPPQELAPPPARRQSKSVVLRSVALVLLLATLGSVLALWQRLGASGTGAATETPVPGYTYTQPTHKGGTVIFSNTGFPDNTYRNFFCCGRFYPNLAFSLWGSLYAINPTGTFLPDELTEIPSLTNGGVSKDELTITLRLRHDLKWSDGQPLTANDLAYWVDLERDPAFLTFGIFGYDDQTFAGYQVVDAYTLVLHYKRLFVSFLYNVPQAAPRHAWGSIPHQELSKHDEVYLYPSVSSGPFMFESKVAGQSVTMIPNRYYRSTTFHQSVLDKLIYTSIPDQDAEIAAFEAGQTDYADGFNNSILSTIAGVQGVQFGRTSGSSHLNFNLSRTAVQDFQVRKAIEEAIDRCGIIEAVFQQLTCKRLKIDTILTPPSLAYDPTITTYKYDLVQARRDMLIAGWDCASGTCMRDGKAFPDLTFATTPSAERKQVAMLLQQYLLALGIHVTPSFYPPPELFGVILPTGQYDLSFYTDLTGIDDDNALYLGFHSSQIPSADNPGGSNLGRVNDPNVDSLLDQARLTPDPAARIQLNKDLQRLLVKDVDQIPFYAVLSITLVNPNIGNYQAHPFGGSSLWNVSDWFLIK